MDVGRYVDYVYGYVGYVVVYVYAHLGAIYPVYHILRSHVVDVTCHTGRFAPRFAVVTPYGCCYRVTFTLWRLDAALLYVGPDSVYVTYVIPVDLRCWTLRYSLCTTYRTFPSCPTFAPRSAFTLVTVTVVYEVIWWRILFTLLWWCYVVVFTLLLVLVTFDGYRYTVPRCSV